MSSSPNYLAEAIGIADGTKNMPVHSEHLRALLKEVPIAHARHFLKGELRCAGCAEWLQRSLLAECEKCPDSFCAECKADHEVYCK